MAFLHGDLYRHTLYNGNTLGIEIQRAPTLRLWIDYGPVPRHPCPKAIESPDPPPRYPDLEVLMMVRGEVGMMEEPVMVMELVGVDVESPMAEMGEPLMVKSMAEAEMMMLPPAIFVMTPVMVVADPGMMGHTEAHEAIGEG